MVSLSRNGCQYRTRLTDQGHAERFASCLRGNSRFTGVMVYESDRAKHETRRWFVTFHPANPAALESLVSRVQSEQDRRAETQWFDYLVVRHESGRWFYVENLNSGEVYECSPHGSCNCPHSEYRLKGAGLRCKHSRIIEIHQALGIAITWAEAIAPEPKPVQLGKLPTCDPALVAARRAEAQRNVNRDFPEF